MSDITNSIFILLENDFLTAIYFQSRFPIEKGGLNSIKTVFQEKYVNKNSVDELFLKLLSFNLPINRYFYGILGKMRDYSLQRYFKLKFKGGNSIGVKRIRFKLAKALEIYAEMFRYEINPNIIKNHNIAIVFYKESLKWWRSPNSILSLGYLYAFSNEIERDIKFAISLFEELINIDKSYFMKEEYFLFLIDYYKGFAYYYLGYIYKYGVGEIKDLEKAKKFFEISKKFNNEHSKKELLS